MDSVGFEIFLNWQTGVLCLGIYLMTYTIRKVVEVSWLGAMGNRFYREIFLPLGPIANGVLISFISKKFPWPEQVSHSTSARVMYAAIAGLASGWFYQRFRSFLKSKGFSTSIAPPSGPGAVPPVVPKQDPPPKIADPKMSDPPPTVKDVECIEDEKTPKR